MSRNIKKEMFQPTTECIDSLVIDDIVGQAVLLASVHEAFQSLVRYSMEQCAAGNEDDFTDTWTVLDQFRRQTVSMMTDKRLESFASSWTVKPIVLVCGMISYLCRLVTTG